MSYSETIAEFESYFRNYISYLPSEAAIKLYSSGKRGFLNRFVHEKPQKFYGEEVSNPVKLWDIEFNIPLFNSAGMFKEGFGYELAARQGAGAFLAGTTTSNARKGNIKNNIKHPFIPFPRSEAALNWMGLPNPGHKVVAKRLSNIQKIKRCPIGASLYKESLDDKLKALELLVEGLNDYEAAGVDFIEINESCPNVEESKQASDESILDQLLIDRLEYVSQNFINKLDRNLPVIVKFSCDTNEEQLEELLRVLVDLNFSGVNFGNTSTEYDRYVNNIHPKERAQYLHFYSNYGGGISGELLKKDSIQLSSKSIKIIEKLNPRNEFHVIRTGGISSKIDIEQSQENGIKMNQWYTGYFKNFASHGHKVYKKFFR